jgi:hypothetical protein
VQPKLILAGVDAIIMNEVLCGFKETRQAQRKEKL